MQLILPVLSLLLAPVAVTACEGDCIVDITNEYLNRYENILLTTLQKGDPNQRATRPRCKP